MARPFVERGIVLASRLEHTQVMGRHIAGIDKMLAATPIGGLSWPARAVAVALVIAGAVGTVAVIVYDAVMDSLTSTEGLIVPFGAIYVAIAIGVVAIVDRGIAELRRKRNVGR